MNRNEMKDAVQAFIDGGGKVTRLRYASEKEQVKAHRKWHHKENNIVTEEGAIEWALDQEGLFLEQGLNQRWGEDDDPQLVAWKEWNNG